MDQRIVGIPFVSQEFRPQRRQLQLSPRTLNDADGFTVVRLCCRRFALQLVHSPKSVPCLPLFLGCAQGLGRCKSGLELPASRLEFLLTEKSFSQIKVPLHFLALVVRLLR